MTADVVQYIITALLGGGLFKGIETLYRAVSDSREKRAISESLGAKTPVEIESASVNTMAVALKSAQDRIAHLENERERDRNYYQSRISDLTSQLERMRRELSDMDQQLSALLAEHRNPTRYRISQDND